jgi:DNA replication protein DnaC
MTLAADAVLTCTRCYGTFNRVGEPLDLGMIVDKREEAAFTCPACRPDVKAEIAARRLRASGLPAALQKLTFERTPAPEDATLAARRWAAGEIQGVLLFGSIGGGKTGLAAAATMGRLRLEPVRWVSVPSLIARSLASFGSDERGDAIAELTGGGTVVLDDLDKVKPSAWVLAQLFVAIDSRVASGAGLFVTTNLRPKEIAATLGEPIASRLAGHCTVRQVNGKDRRLLRSIDGGDAA